MENTREQSREYESGSGTGSGNVVLRMWVWGGVNRVLFNAWALWDSPEMMTTRTPGQ